MADLSYLGPQLAAVVAGRQAMDEGLQRGITAQKDQADTNLLNQSFGYNEQANPLKVEGLRLGNQRASAELPGVVAEAQGKVLDTRAKGDTYDSNVAATISKNKSQVSDDKFKDFERGQKVFAMAGDHLEQVPPALRMNALVGILQQNGMADDPAAQPALAAMSRMPPEQLPAQLRSLAEKLGKTAASMSPAYHQALDVAKEQGEKARDVARISAGATVEAARLNSTARVEAAKSRAGAVVQDTMKRVAMGLIPADRVPAAMELEARRLESGGDEAGADAIREQAKMMNNFVLSIKNPKPDTSIDGNGIHKDPKEAVYGGDKDKSPAVKKDAQGRIHLE